MENSVSETLNSTSRQWSVLQIGSKSLCGFSFSKFSTNNVNGFFVIAFDSLEISTFWKRLLLLHGISACTLHAKCWRLQLLFLHRWLWVGIQKPSNYAWITLWKIGWVFHWTKMNFSIKHFFSKYEQIHWKLLQIWSHLPRKSLMEGFIFFAVSLVGFALAAIQALCGNSNIFSSYMIT